MTASPVPGVTLKTTTANNIDMRYAEAGNGFAQPALRAGAALLRDKAHSQGIAATAIRNSHHFAALWPDIEPFASEGFIALALVLGLAGLIVLVVMFLNG